MSNQQDPYAVLGVLATSDDVVIRGAYRALMQKYHPDTNGSPEATRRASEINQAYDTLGDPARRAAYDDMHRAQARRPSTKGRAPEPDASAGSPDGAARRMASMALSAVGAGAGMTNPTLAMMTAAVVVIGAMGALTATSSRQPTVMGQRHEQVAETGRIASGIRAVTPTKALKGDPDNVTDVFNARTPEREVDVAPMIEEAPAPDAMDRQKPAPALDHAVIAKAARDVDRDIRNGGVTTAQAWSSACHGEVERRPTWSGADRCAAYDYAVRLIDVQVAQARGTPENGYFRSGEATLADLYGASSLGRDLVRARLQRIRGIATTTAFEVLQTRLNELASTDAANAQDQTGDAQGR